MLYMKTIQFFSIFSKKKLTTIEILLPLTISVTGHFRIFHILSAELQVPLTRTLPWHKQSHHFCYKFTTEMCVCTLIICCDQRAICETMASDKNRLGRRKVRVHTERDGRWSYTFTFSKGSHTGHNYKKIQCRLNRFIHIWTCFYSPLHRNIIWSVKAVSVLRIFVSLLLLLLLYTFLWNSRMTELRVHVRLWTLNNII